MPYVEAWNETDPPGTEQAKNIDEHFRKIRRQLTERFDDKLFADFAADPLVLKDEISGKKDGKVLIIPAHLFVGQPVGGFPNYTTDGVGFDSTVTLYSGLILPVGTTIKRLRFHFSSGGAVVQMNGRLVSTPITPPLTTTVLTTVTSNAAGERIADSGDITWPVLVSVRYHLEVYSNSLSDTTFAMAEVTYNTPTHRDTI